MGVKAWEYRRLMLKTPIKGTELQDGTTIWTYFGKAQPEDSLFKDDELALLGQEGWELVSTVPIIGGLVRQGPSNQWGTAYTIGYVLWLKRPLAN